MIDMLAKPIGAQHETAGPERALVQPFDRLRVVEVSASIVRERSFMVKRGIASGGGAVHRLPSGNLGASVGPFTAA